jgi:hypothetical protein
LRVVAMRSGKRGFPSKVRSSSFYEAPHDVAYVDILNLVLVTVSADKTIAVEEAEEQAEVVLFAVVGRSGEKQEVAGKTGKK